MRSPNRQQGEYAEDWVAARHGLAHVPGEASWYDCRNAATGTKHEVKSTHETISGAHNDAGEGEFRLWADQHKSLLASDAAGVAWYDFVLLDGSGNVVDHQKRKPSTVSTLVRENGGWRPAGHADRDGLQCTLPHSVVFD
jgi:hypothetical protein